MKKMCMFFVFLQLGVFSQESIIEKKYRMEAEYRAKQIQLYKPNTNKFSAAQTISYTVSSISYTPFTDTLGTAVLAGLDDIWSDSLVIGFNFCYFSHTYSKTAIGSNGELTFDIKKAN